MTRLTLRRSTALVLALAIVLVGGCDSEGSEQDEMMFSRFGNTESHNAGANCMSCHRPGGDGEGVFVVAGTVYGQNGGAPQGTVVEITSQPNGKGEILMSLEVDAHGNFYTTEPLSFGTGPYASVSFAGESSHMTSPIATGACSTCHGVSASEIAVP